MADANTESLVLNIETHTQGAKRVETLASNMKTLASAIESVNAAMSALGTIMDNLHIPTINGALKNTIKTANQADKIGTQNGDNKAPDLSGESKVENKITKATGDNEKTSENAEKAAKSVDKERKAFTTLSSAVKAVTTAKRALLKVMLKVSKVALEVGKNMAKAFGNAILAPIRNIVNGVRSLTIGLKGVLGAMTRIAKRMLFRSIIKQITEGLSEGINNAYHWSKAFGGDFAKSMDSVATSLAYMKNAIGAAAIPVIEALAPIIERLTNRFVELVNYVNQFISAMTGAKTWTKATRVATEYAEAEEKTTKNATKAAKKVKELQKSLMGFDEINRLNGNDDLDNFDSDISDDSNDKEKGPDYSLMFDQVPIESKIKALVDKIKGFIKNGAFYELGAYLGKSLNDVLNSIDFEGWGAKLGTLINNACSVVNGFMDTHPFETLGRKIADFLNGAFTHIDSTNLGKALSTKINAIIDLAYGFVQNFKFSEFGTWLGNVISSWFLSIQWEKMAKTISDGIKKVFDMAINFVRSLDVVKITQEINNFIARIDFKGIMSKASDTIIAALDKLIDFLTTFDWENAGDSIADAFGGIKFDKIIPKLFSALSKTIVGLLKMIGGFLGGEGAREGFSNIADGFGNGLKEINWKEIAEALFKLLVNGITLAVNVVSSLAKALADVISNAISTLCGGGDLNADAENLGTSIAEGIKSAFTKCWENFKIRLPEFYWDSADAYEITGVIGKALDALGLPTSIPKLKVKWPEYATGGFPEDGLFYANHNELVGQFNNGKTAVANNMQIQDGIEEAAYRGFVRAMESKGNGGNGSYTFVAQLNGRTLFEEVVNQNNASIKSRGFSPIKI